ncbi:MAG: sigma-54-dependent Fis family transcriptional regulator [Planctomycetes bacterium]|nr:sigma-54-dependent Fis family transcriptional regulator [Planctomycetota bacterium]
MADSIAFFVRRAGYDVETATSGAEALSRMASAAFDIVLTDLRMPRMSGLALLDEVKHRDPDVEVLVVTGHPEVETAVHAIKHGAFDYVTKPFDEAQLMARVEKAAAHRELVRRNAGLRERLRAGSAGRRLVYRSARFAETIERLERAARTDASVLIQGESGTGKELLAHHLHDCSTRSGERFVPVDCATMPENLVESELFGHVKGAFSGAVGHKMGLFQVADGGTLFLDEIGELPLTFQTKLLRAIQEREIRRVGGTETIEVDVRIVAATNRNLQREVEQGRFRQDLYYRLDVVRIDVPPLRERIEDVEELARHFLEEFRRETGGGPGPRDFAPEALVALKSYDWPGNVRQLKNAIDRACALGSGSRIETCDLPDDISKGTRAEATIGTTDGRPLGSFQEMKARKVAAIESTYVSELLRRHEGNVTRSAEEAGMSRSAFQKLMQRYAIKSSDFREE